MRYLVILDAGHGNRDSTPGKRSPLFDDGTFMAENDFNRVVVRKIDALLEKYADIDTFFTVTEKRDVSLDERVARANDVYNKYKDLYDKIVLISIHANALNGVWGTQNGTTTYHYPTNMVDKAFAEVIQKNLVAKTGLNNRGVLGGNFQIIREPKMTACLCECAFMDNLVEAKLLLTDNFRNLVAEGIVSGLSEYFGINGITTPTVTKVAQKVEYSVTANGTYQLKGNVENFGVKVVNQRNNTIEEPYCTNGSFFWHDAKGVTYPTSILIQNGVILQDIANHYNDFGCPQNVFIVYINGKVEMKKVNFAHDLDYKNIQVAIGGIGLRDTTNANFVYNPASEGFKKDVNKLTGKTVDYSDVLRKTNKTVIGYNKTENKIYLMCRPSIYHKSLLQYDLLKLVKDCEFDISLSVDGGGSTFLNNADNMVLKGDNRIINNIIGFGL